MIVIAGAGIVGAAIAYALRESGHDTFILEKERHMGCGISSRNSGVIHAGLYYPRESLKEELCHAGRQRLYAFCREHKVPHKKTGKYVVAQNTGEEEILYDILKHAGHRVPLNLTTELPEGVRGTKALFSPETGILDVTSAIEKMIELSGATFLPGQKVACVQSSNRHVAFKVNGETETCSYFFNACGLGAPLLAGMQQPKPHAKGSYFQIAVQPPYPIASLIYPAVPRKSSSLGTHLTIDMQGSLLLGPNLRWVDELDYKVDLSEKEAFFKSASRFLPWLKIGHLEPGYVGYRPKLAGPEFRDFMLKKQGRALHCLGIESPGITSSLALGEKAREMMGL
ncbi:MAG: FAD-dependent oxidoreductase [Acidobacteria bacterium]|nr:MAG: FAD-dependent oxidoreductase [Acidobacteriota bacterium]